MGEVNFYLKKPNEAKQHKDAKCLIYLQFRFHGKKLVVSTRRSIEPKYWNEQKQRAKANNIPGYVNLNDNLDSIQKACKIAYDHESRSGGVPDKNTLKAHVLKHIYQNEVDPNKPTLTKLIERFINGEIRSGGKEKAINTLYAYKNVQKHLYNYGLKIKKVIDFEDVTLEFFYGYTHYLSKELNLKRNTIAKNIKILKAFMGEAVDLNYTSNLAFRSRKFSASPEETDSIALSWKEIAKLHSFDLSHNPRLEAVKDLFVFGCRVGFRYSDYSTIKRENIIVTEGKTRIRIKQKKTPNNPPVEVICDKIALEILEKYKHNHNSLPIAKKNQPFNADLKEVCRLAGLTEKGRLASEPEKELYKCISSHTARRSFATHYSNKGVNTRYLMQITGHKTEFAFARYLKNGSDYAVNELMKHQDFADIPHGDD